MKSQGKESKATFYLNSNRPAISRMQHVMTETGKKAVSVSDHFQDLMTRYGRGPWWVSIRAPKVFVTEWTKSERANGSIGGSID